MSAPTTPPLPPELAIALLKAMQTPGRTALLLDIDGCLAPVSDDVSEIFVPAETTRILTELHAMLGLVGCITARHPGRARALVGVPGMMIAGDLGSTLLRRGNTEFEIHPDVQPWLPALHGISDRFHEDQLAGYPEVAYSRGTASAAFHHGDLSSRPDLAAVFAAMEAEAVAAGLKFVRNAFSSDIYPPVGPTKAVALLDIIVAGPPAPDGVEPTAADTDAPTWDTVIYVGDGRSDVQAMRALRQAEADGQIAHGFAIGVLSRESPLELMNGSVTHVVLDNPPHLARVLDTLNRALNHLSVGGRQTPGPSAATRSRRSHESGGLA